MPADALAAEPSVFCSYDRDKFIGDQRLDGERIVARLAFDDPDIGLAAGDALFHLGRIAAPNVHHDSRVSLLESDEMRRQPIVRDRLARRDGDATDPQICEVVKAARG